MCACANAQPAIRARITICRKLRIIQGLFPNGCRGGQHSQRSEQWPIIQLGIRSVVLFKTRAYCLVERDGSHESVPRYNWLLIPESDPYTGLDQEGKFVV